MTSEPVGIDALPQIGPAVMVMGVFDGLHLGHRAMLEAARAAGHERGASSVALVFDPHPEEVLRPGIAVPYLAPLAANLTRIERLGIDHAIAVRFDTALRSLSAEEFLAALGTALDLRGLVMSPESAFGRDRGGTVARMRELGIELGFEVIIVPPTMVDGDVVSSSRVRAAIEAGDVVTARRLGAPAYVEGTVVRGDGRGRELGFPTANLAFDYVPAMPQQGIYAARVTELSGGALRAHPALVNIGVRPTFHDEGTVLVEAHILDYAGDLYGHRIAVELVARLRDELRFPSAAALVEQMRRDVEDGRRALAGEQGHSA